MKTTCRNILWSLLLGFFSLSAVTAQDEEFLFRVDVLGGVAGPVTDGIVPWTMDISQPLPACVSVEIEIEIVLSSALVECLADPELCSGGEIPPAGADPCMYFACYDGIDNDDDGRIDFGDPDCAGVLSWNISVVTDQSFNLGTASVEGTVADSCERPPGRHDTRFGGQYTEIVDPFFQ